MYAVPVIVGPHTENFRDIMELFARAAALTVVREEHELQAAFLDLLSDGPRRRNLGQRAFDLLQQQSGATARTLAATGELLAASFEGPQRSNA